VSDTGRLLAFVRRALLRAEGGDAPVESELLALEKLAGRPLPVVRSLLSGAQKSPARSPGGRPPTGAWVRRFGSAADFVAGREDAEPDVDWANPGDAALGIAYRKARLEGWSAAAARERVAEDWARAWRDSGATLDEETRRKLPGRVAKAVEREAAIEKGEAPMWPGEVPGLRKLEARLSEAFERPVRFVFLGPAPLTRSREVLYIPLTAHRPFDMLGEVLDELKRLGFLPLE
jgi:hypothetical protein